MPAPKLRLAVNVAGALLFGAAAVVQLNDPDPLPWVAIYGGAALAAAAWRRWRPAGYLAAAVAVVAVAWAAAIAAGMDRWVAPARLFEPMEMGGGPVEQGREVAGLALVALCGAALALSHRNHTRAGTPPVRH